MGRSKVNLLFDINKQRVVVLCNEIYYSMEDGRVIGHLSIAHNIIPKRLQPYKVENCTKWIPVDKEFISKLQKAIPFEHIEYGIKFDLDGHILWLIYDDQDCFQLRGHFPRYFFKEFTNFINNLPS